MMIYRQPDRHDSDSFSSLKSLSVHHDDGHSLLLGGGVQGEGATSPLARKIGVEGKETLGVFPPSLVDIYRVIQTNLDFDSFLKKRRSLWFFYANAVFRSIRDLGVLEENRLRFLEYYFERWRKDYRKKYVHLVRGDTHVFIKQYSRFDEDYRRFLRRKLRLLNFMLWDLKIELTVDPKKCMRYVDGFYLLQKGWNRLNSWLKRRFGDFEYFKVLEITKAGRPHFHVLISGIKWIDQDELSRLWDSYGCGRVVYVKRVFRRNNLKMCAYVMKYVNKTLRNGDRLFSAVLFASNKRLFSMSKGCQNIINVGKLPRMKKGFEFAGSVCESELIAFCNEKGIEIEAFMIIEAETVDYYEFPELFNVYEYG